MDPLRKTIESYDRIAEEHCEKTLDQGDREFQEDMMDRTFQMLRSSPRLIDLGCGDGRDSHYFYEKGADVVGIDLSKNMIQLARQNYPDCAFLNMDMRDTVFPDDTFHAAWASASIINMPKSELSKIESEVYRIIEPGGIFAFSIKVGEGEGFEEDSVVSGHPRYFAYYTIDELKDRLRLFQVTESQEYPGEIFGSRFAYCWTRSKRK